MQGNQASSPGDGYVTRDLSSCSTNMGYILELQRGWAFETPLSSFHRDIGIPINFQEESGLITF